jgi:hypothetical protein
VHTHVGRIQFVAYNNCPGLFPHEVQIYSQHLEIQRII